MSKFFGGAGSDTESSSDSGGKIYQTRTDDMSRRSKGSRYIVGTLPTLDFSKSLSLRVEQ